MSPAPKTVLCIHDLPGFGRAGLSVIVPILSAMGVQAVAVPTAVLSPTPAGWARRLGLQAPVTVRPRWPITAALALNLTAFIPVICRRQARPCW